MCSLMAAGGAMAADLPARVPAKGPPPLPVPVVYNWTGFYFGVNFGGGFASQDTSLISTATGATVATGSVSPNGIILGDQVGYNWQVRNWVFGIEADFQGSTQKEDGTLAALGSTVAYTSRLQWFGTVRGRVGWAFDRYFPYLTGGWAFGRGQIDGTATTGVVTRNFSANESYSGWTVGAGIEMALWDRWTGKLEYLYIDFGDGPTTAATATTLNISGSQMTQNVARVGLNYRF